MLCAKLALLLLSVVAVAVCSNRRDGFKRHSQLVKRYPCGEPQPRVFELEDVVPADVLKERGKNTIKPPVTVLHRCQSSGCCENPNERCMPTNTAEVTLTFAVLHPKNVEYFDTIALNHTHCSCSKEHDQNIK